MNKLHKEVEGMPIKEEHITLNWEGYNTFKIVSGFKVFNALENLAKTNEVSFNGENI